MLVTSLMNSRTSSTCVHEASLLSRTPRAAEMLRPLPQIPLKPASSTILAERPLWASMMNSRSLDSIRARSFVDFFIATEADNECRSGSADCGPCGLRIKSPRRSRVVNYHPAPAINYLCVHLAHPGDFDDSEAMR